MYLCAHVGVEELGYVDRLSVLLASDLECVPPHGAGLGQLAGETIFCNLKRFLILVFRRPGNKYS